MGTGTTELVVAGGRGTSITDTVAMINGVSFLLILTPPLNLCRNLLGKVED